MSDSAVLAVIWTAAFYMSSVEPASFTVGGPQCMHEQQQSFAFMRGIEWAASVLYASAAGRSSHMTVLSHWRVDQNSQIGSTHGPACMLERVRHTM